MSTFGDKVLRLCGKGVSPFGWLLRIAIGAFALWTCTLQPQQECHIGIQIWMAVYIWWYFF